MAIVVEDGTGISAANSYVTVEEVDDYCSQRGLSEWENASDDDKEAALMRGMDYIESFRFRGDKVNFENPLEWPRLGWYNEVSYGTTAYILGAYDAHIPLGVKRATCRAAYEELMNKGTLQASLSKEDFIQSETVDVITTSYFDSMPGSIVDSFPVIKNHLKGLLRDSVVVRRT
jgi:hypothetical protein